MFKSLLVIVGALGIGAPTFAQVTLKAGQTWTLGFNSIPYLGVAPNNPSSFGLVTVELYTAPGGPANVTGPATFTLDLFENTLSDQPLTFSLTWTNQYALGASAKNIWTDHQGWIRLHVVTGELQFASMNIDTYEYSGGGFIQRYESTFYQPSLSEVLSTNSSGILQSTLQWPTLNALQTSPNAVRYTLQSSLSSGSGSWSDITNQPVVVPGASSVTVDPVGSQRFYRLIETNFSVVLQ
jgi:hypothetical protein